MYLVINNCVTAVKVSNFSGHYLRNRSTLDIGVLGYIGIVQHKEHSAEVLYIPPGTPCIYIILYTHTHFLKFKHFDPMPFRNRRVSLQLPEDFRLYDINYYSDGKVLQINMAELNDVFCVFVYNFPFLKNKGKAVSAHVGSFLDEIGRKTFGLYPR